MPILSQCLVTKRKIKIITMLDTKLVLVFVVCHSVQQNAFFFWVLTHDSLKIIHKDVLQLDLEHRASDIRYMRFSLVHRTFSPRYIQGSGV